MLYCYLERLAVLFGALAERGSLPSAVSSASTSETATLVITRAWIPQKRVIIAFSFGVQAAKLERVSHSQITSLGVPTRSGYHQHTIPAEDTSS